MKISELALRQPVVIACDATVADTAALMASSGVGSVIVLEGQTPVGIVTDRDIVTRGVARSYPADGRIDGLMTMGLVAVDVDHDLADLVHAFRDHAIRRIPIIDHDRVIGVVALDDIVVHVADELSTVSRVLAGQIMFLHATEEARTPSPA
jgi:signal-transduction protein with cAMP-binding, CBS, and nucleotidyltransferase domain